MAKPFVSKTNMNNREQSRYEKYIQQYPILSTTGYKERLYALCEDPKIGFPPLRENQKAYRASRKKRDELVLRLYEEACNQAVDSN
jgi:hypothetical protein